MMKKKLTIFVTVSILVIAAIFLCLYLKKKNDEQTLLSAEYAYANIFMRTKVLLDNIGEQTYDTPEEAYYKTNFILGQIDLKQWKKDVEKCLLDNGISYETSEDEDLLQKCGQPFIDKIIKFSQSKSITEENFVDSFLANNLSQIVSKTYETLKKAGYSEGAFQMAPIIAYTRLDVYQCIKKAGNCLNDKTNSNKKVSDCLSQCYLDYLKNVDDVLKDYEYSITK